MCLFLYRVMREPKVAKRDITVYKWLYYDQKTGQPTSPYQHFKWTIGQTYRVSRRDWNMTKKHAADFSVLDFGFHAFRDRKSAEAFKYLKALPWFVSLFKCVIPKGAE